MKYIKQILLFIVLLPFATVNAQVKKVAFIGNSMTDYKGNHAIDMLHKMLDATGDSITIEVIASNGTSLYGHLHTGTEGSKGTPRGFAPVVDDFHEAETIQRLMADTFDLVIVQETPLSLLSDNFRENKSLPSFKVLDSLARSVGSKVIWTEPYSIAYDFEKRKNKHPYYNGISNVDSAYAIANRYYEEELLLVNDSLGNLPVFYIAKEFMKNNPNAPRFGKSGSHPAKLMQYILALTWFYEITGKGPDDIPDLNIYWKHMKERGIKYATYNYYSEYYKE